MGLYGITVENNYPFSQVSGKPLLSRCLHAAGLPSAYTHMLACRHGLASMTPVPCARICIQDFKIETPSAFTHPLYVMDSLVSSQAALAGTNEVCKWTTGVSNSTGQIVKLQPLATGKSYTRLTSQSVSALKTVG